MKKVGIFFYTFLPMLLSISFQFITMFFLMGVSGVVSFAATGSLDSMFQMLYSNLDYSMMISVMFAFMNIVVFGLWYYCRFEGDFLPNPRKTFEPRLFGGLILIAPAAQIAAGAIVVILDLINSDWLKRYEDLMETAGLDKNMSLLMIVYAVLLGPIGEELIFRGVTLRSARRIFPFWAANIMQAVLFGIFHLNIIQGCYAFALGLLLGIVCEKFGSIYYSIFLHICFNFIGTVVSSLIGNPDKPLEILAYYGISGIAGLGALFLFYFGYRRKRTLSDGQ